MNIVAISWRDKDGDVMNTVGWVVDADKDQFTICADYTDNKENPGASIAYRGLRIHMSDILNITNVECVDDFKESGDVTEH